MSVKLHHDWESLSTLNWEEKILPQGAKSYIRDLLHHPSKTFFKNVETRFAFWETEKALLPLTINQTEYDNAYTASFYTYYTACASKEIHHCTRGASKLALQGAIQSAKKILQWGKINRSILINNWLFSTNLYPECTAKEMTSLLKTLTQSHPQHALIFRSLDERLHAQHLENLAQAGCLLIPYRQVFYLDPQDKTVSKARMFKSDAQLASKSSFEWVVEFSPSDHARLLELYRKVYMEKHFAFHPDFTLSFMESVLKERFLHVLGLRNQAGILEGMVAYYVLNGVMTVPMIGYNTALPQQEGVYRILNHYVLERARENGWLYNMSSGASTFKRLRRSQPAMEWAAVYVNHLPLAQRLLWKGIHNVMHRWGKALIEEHGK